ncbi:SPAT7 protein, partial [Nothocercus nigrocapillus]|nr:SPAT7 protein [Nothocercus nigrocapillus]
VADQQRREKLKKKIARCEKEMSEGKNGSRSSSRESGRVLSSSLGKSSLEAEDSNLLFPSAQRAHYWRRALLPPDEQDLVRSSPVKYSGKYSRNTSNTSNSSFRTSSPLRKTSGLSCSCSNDSFVGISHSQQRQETKSKVYSRDLLERHSDFFTNSRKPFTPRTLISDAKSFLSQYRYYTPARRKRKSRYKQQVDAETQTDVISFPSADKASERRVMTEHQKIAMKAEDKRHILEKSQRASAFKYSFPRYLIYSRKKYVKPSLLLSVQLVLRPISHPGLFFLSL